MGRHENALSDFNRAVGMGQGHDWYLYDRAKSYRVLGRTDEARSDLSAAIRYANQEYERDPEHWQNTLNLALYYLAAEEPDRAGVLYEEALSDGDSAVSIHEAITDLNDFLVLFPHHAQARSTKDMLMKALGHV